MPSRNTWALVVSTILFLAFASFSCGNVEPETLEATLARAANVTTVKYELIPSGSTEVTKVWVKGSKWRIELPPKVPLTVNSRVAQGYFVDTEAQTCFIWYTPGNIVEEAFYKTAGNVVQFSSAMTS
jgi:hypothetical protein